MASRVQKKLLELENISKTFFLEGREFCVLKNIACTITSGEFVAITGHSGSGKTTLMHIIGCLDKPTTGAYLLDGVDISTLSADEMAHIRNKKIGFVFQKFHLLKELTAQDNVALPLLYAGWNEHDAREKAAEFLARVNLAHRLSHYPYQLSGGEQQRVAIARAIINDPELLLADEPTGNLDTKTGSQIVNLLREIQKSGKTIILVTHDTMLASQAERQIVMQDGVMLSDSSRN